MAAYVYIKEGFDLEIFRVDKPAGRWLAIGTHKDVFGFTCFRYLDVLPKGCKRMNREAEPYRHMHTSDLLHGEEP